MRAREPRRLSPPNRSRCIDETQEADKIDMDQRWRARIGRGLLVPAKTGRDGGATTVVVHDSVEP